MGRRDASSGSGSGSDSGSDSGSSRSRSRDRTSKKRQKKESSSRSSKEERREKKDKKKSRKKDDKKSDRSSRKKESKKSSSKSSKKDRKKDRKRKRSRSRSSDSSSDSSSDDEDAPRSRSSAAAAAPIAAIPPPSASSVTRGLGLIEKLLAHGGGDRTTSLQEVQFLLFKLDAGSSVVVDAIPDPLVRHILSSLFREMGLHVRHDPATSEQGWMSPVDAQGRVAYKLLDSLAAAFRAEEKSAPSQPSAIIGPIGPSAPPPAAAAASAPAADAPAGPRVLGPAMPRPEDFERLAAGNDDAPAHDEDDDDGGNFGPKMPSQMTPQELLAFERLRESREQLSALKAASKNAKPREGGRDEWMTALPAGDAGMPSTTALATLIASGDMEAMKGRGFQTKAVVKHGQDDDWAMSPAEKERKQQERIAIKHAEQAVYNSSRAISGVDLHDLTGRGRESANETASAAQAANDRMMARYKQQQTSTAESLVAAHSRAAEAAQKSSELTNKDGLFKWDHAEQMGSMRAVKGAAALKGALSSAFTLNDSFAPAAQ